MLMFIKLVCIISSQEFVIKWFNLSYLNSVPLASLVHVASNGHAALVKFVFEPRVVACVALVM